MIPLNPYCFSLRVWRELFPKRCVKSCLPLRGFKFERSRSLLASGGQHEWVSKETVCQLDREMLIQYCQWQEDQCFRFCVQEGYRWYEVRWYEVRWYDNISFTLRELYYFKGRNFRVFANFRLIPRKISKAVIRECLFPRKMPDAVIRKS